MAQDSRIIFPPPSGTSYLPMTAAVSTTDAVTGVSTGVSFPVVAGATYLLSAGMGITSAATTTAHQYALIRSNGCTLTYCNLFVGQLSGGIVETGSSTSVTDGFTNGTTGPGATERSGFINALIIVATTGTLTLQLRSEVGASAVTIIQGAARLERVS